MDPLIIGGLALLLMGGRGGKGGSSAARTDAATDGAVLQARANQPSAAKWGVYFRNQGLPSLVADALVRWTGIESAGFPTRPSAIGELGLLQCQQATALQVGGPYNAAEWAALGSAATTNEEQTRLAIKLYQWCWKRAKRLITNPPDGLLDTVWYAKLYHQRPKDVKDGHLHGPAKMMARELAVSWRNDAQKMHYLRAANVVAFGVPAP